MESLKRNKPVTIEINGIPLPWKAPFVGTRGSYSPRYHEAKIIKLEIASQYQGELLEGALNCNLTFYMPIPKGTSKKRRALMLSGFIRPTKRPDRTNMAKFYEDLLHGIVYEDDGAIVDGITAKYYGEEPKTVIEVTVL